MIAIEKQLRRYFVLVTIISVLVIFILSNLGMTYFFNSYVRQAEIKSDQKIVQYIEDLLRIDKGLSMSKFPGLMQFIWGEGAEILLLDTAGNLLFDSRGAGNMHRGKGWGPGMGLQQDDGAKSKDLVFLEYPIQIDGVEKAVVRIGREQTLLASTADRVFFLTMNAVFLIALLLSIGLVFIVSKRISGKFLRPLLVVKQNIGAISKGNPQDKIIPVISNTTEIQELAKATEELSQTIKAQNQLRKRLTSDISHELRTPLATIQSHLEAMIDGVWEPSPQRLSFCYDELIRLTRLINDLNELSVLESDKIKLNSRKVQLTQLLKQMIENFQPMFSEKNIFFTGQLEPNVEIIGDEDRLKQIFVNILSNAYKYTSNEGKVTVSLATEQGWITVIVKDNGSGISSQDLPHIFERFYRGDLSRSRETGGSGIGLTIVKALVEAHGGILKVESQQSAGTKVTINLPKIL